MSGQNQLKIHSTINCRHIQINFWRAPLSWLIYCLYPTQRERLWSKNTLTIHHFVQQFDNHNGKQTTRPRLQENICGVLYSAVDGLLWILPKSRISHFLQPTRNHQQAKIILRFAREIKLFITRKPRRPTILCTRSYAITLRKKILLLE